MENYRGKKVIGFKYETSEDGLEWDARMDKHIGEIGTVIIQHNNAVGIKFENSRHWYYPIELIDDYLIEKLI